MKRLLKNNNGQVAIYVVVAIVIVVGIVLYFTVVQKNGNEGIPQSLVPVFDYYQSCIEGVTKNAIDLAGTQGGRVAETAYLPGSDFAPFSSHLNFLSTPVGYWYYVAGNGVVKENVPTINDMQNDISRYVENHLADCDFSSFSAKGFAISRGAPHAVTTIADTKVSVVVTSDFSVVHGSENARKTTENVEVSSKLGKFYGIAKTIYDREKKDSFFEQYATDVLYNYAPVDGVELQCGPKVWGTKQVMDDLKNGLSNNFATIKFDGNYYSLKNSTRKYFVVDTGVDEAVNVIYSQDWSTKIQIDGRGVDDTTMIAEPVGTQSGLGAMGFCYVPYHFVYSVSFPTMIQIYNNNELFQFPVVVVIDRNAPRVANISSDVLDTSEVGNVDVCEFRNKNVQVHLFDINLNPIDGNVSYECFDQRCSVGETTNGALNGMAPTCANGNLIVRSDGYAEKRQMFSTNSETSADIVLDRQRKINVSLSIDGVALKDNTIVAFTRDDGFTATLSAPQMSSIALSEGNYEVRVYVYGNSSVTLPASTKYQCVDVPREGILGIFGSTQEKCFDVTIPATNVGYALIGGGVVNEYLLDTEIAKGNLALDVPKLQTPNSVDTLTKNFELLETKKPRLRFYE